MRYIFLFLIFLFCNSAFGQELLLTGVFKGESLYIQNPYDADSGQFCIQSIEINGKQHKVNLALTAVRLNFKAVDLFTPVSVKIHYGDSCRPKFVNPEAILYHSNFKYDSLVLNDSIMHWYTKGDRRDGKYEVEKLKGDSWNIVKSIHSKGRWDGTQYVYFPDHVDGGNKYRIRYSLPSGRYLYSSEMEHYHYPEGVSFSPRVVIDKMNLSREAVFEIYQEGDLVLQGKAKVIPLRRLAPGSYTISFDGGEEDSFVKK